MMATAPKLDEPPARTAHKIDGNSLTLLPTGADGGEAVLALIAGAKTTLDVLYYIYADDDSGRSVTDALVAAQKRGVQVRLVIDGFGSSDTPAALFEPLLEAGGKFCRFNPNLGRRYVLRNHQKMTIADGSQAVIGGFNIADTYLDQSRPDGWRDLGLLIEGPAVAHLSRYYDALHKGIVRKAGSIIRLRRMLKDKTQKTGKLRWVFGGPGPVSPYARQVRADLKTAKSLSMMMAYFAPNRRMLRQMRTVAQRGGEARIVTAGNTDFALALLAARATYRHLLKYDVKISEYVERPLHAKLIVLDDAVYIGSGNFDIRSLYINLEMMLRIEDAGFAAEVRDLFEADFAKSRPIEPQAFKQEAGWWNRLRWGFAYFMFTTVDLLLARRVGE